MSDGFDLSNLDALQRKLLNVAEKEMPKEMAKFLKKEGDKLRRRTIATAKRNVKQHTGNYLKSIKRGKVYVYKQNGALSVRVYSNAPHAHLIEYGHLVVNGGKLGRGSKRGKGQGQAMQKDGKEVFVEGKHVLENSLKDFQTPFYNDVEKFIDDVVVKGVTK